MKRIIYIILVFTISNLYADLKDQTLELKNDLTKKIFQKISNRPIKIAVVNFTNIGDETLNSKAGDIISSQLSNDFANDKNFITVERNRLDRILEELRLSALGVIDEKDIKRIGIVLGVDWIVVGEVSLANNEFVVNARVVNPETAEIIAASSINIEKQEIIKEEELSNLSKNYFGLSAGKINFSKLNFNTSSFGVELRHNYSRKSYGKFAFRKTANNSKPLDKLILDKYLITDGGSNPIYDIVITETIESITSFEMIYGWMKNFIFKTRIKAEIGANFNSLSSKQNIYYSNRTASSSGVFNIPVNNDKTYYLPGFSVGVGIEKNILKSHILSIDFKYGSFAKLKRDVSAGNNSKALQDQINLKVNSQKISMSYTYIGMCLKFPF
jgi:TolB-like protein